MSCEANGSKNNGASESIGIETKTPFLIGVAGGTASGKVSLSTVSLHCILLEFFLMLQSTVCKRIMEQLGQADMDHTQRQVNFR